MLRLTLTLILAIFSSKSIAQEFDLQEFDLSSIDPALIASLSPAQQAAIMNQAQQVIDVQEPSEPTLLTRTDVPKSIKFGYDYIKTTPTSIAGTSDLPVPNEYKLSLNDELKIILTGAKKSIFSSKVKLDGTIFLPELGAISVVGETFVEIKNKIRNVVESEFVGVDVDISIENLSAKKINIIGAVKNPGIYLVNPFSTISSSLAYTGGVEEYGSLRSIKLIEQNGDVIEFDLYDLLIFGDRSKDVTINSGDTIIVQATDNFVNITGEVIRPFVYEYMSTDSFADLLTFSLGAKWSANLKDLFVNEIIGDTVVTSSIVLEDNINKMYLTDFVIGGKAISSNQDILVQGSPVDDGYFKKSKYSDLASLISDLKFSDSIYPYFFIVKQNDNLGEKTIIDYFSLKDSDTYQDLPLKNNVEIKFFSKKEILTSDFGTDKEGISYVIPKFYMKGVKFGSNNYLLPFTGKVNTLEISDYINDGSVINEELVSVFTKEGIKASFFNKDINSEELIQLNFPEKSSKVFTVTIDGQILNPGTYNVNSLVTLNDLYIMSGGLTENASERAIILTRESVKQNEILELESAKKALLNFLLTKASTGLLDGDSGTIDPLPLLNLIENVEVSGRISGNLKPESTYSSSLYLEPGDKIFIPFEPTTVTVLGEVLNPLTTTFEENKTYIDFIKEAGNYTSNADKSNIYIIRTDGNSVPLRRGLLGKAITIMPGDTIVVPRDLDKIETLPLISLATKILSDLAFSAASLNALNNN